MLVASSVPYAVSWRGVPPYDGSCTYRDRRTSSQGRFVVFSMGELCAVAIRKAIVGDKIYLRSKFAFGLELTHGISFETNIEWKPWSKSYSRETSSLARDLGSRTFLCPKPRTIACGSKDLFA